MKRFYLKFRVMLMTFALGLSGVFLFNDSLKTDKKITVNLPQTESAEVIEIITKRNWRGFEVTGHGCGGRNEYGGECSATGYVNENFEGVSVSNCGYQNLKNLNREIELRIKKSVRIFENTQNEKLGSRRIVLERIFNNERFFDVILNDGSMRLKIITAKKIDLLNDFEQWEELRD
jgi:hypothetical protein